MQTKNTRPCRFRRYFSVPITKIIPPSPPNYLRPTYDNPVIGDMPDYINGVISIVGSGMFAMWYYDELDRPILEYGDLTDHRIRNYMNRKDDK